MKNLTIAIVLVLGTINVFGQGKPDLLTNDYIKANGTIATSTALLNNIHTFNNNNSFHPQSIWLSAKGKSIMHLTPLPGLYQIDSVMLYVRKSQLRWINDSTAVITPIK